LSYPTQVPFTVSLSNELIRYNLSTVLVGTLRLRNAGGV